MGGKAAMPIGVSAPSYSFLEETFMQSMNRLVAAGMDPEKAFDIAFFFAQQNNESGLERYICELERGQRQLPKD